VKNLRKILALFALCAFVVGVSLVPLAEAKAFTLNYSIKNPNTNSQSTYPNQNQNNSNQNQKPDTNTPSTPSTPSKPETTLPQSPSVPLPTGLTADEAAMVKMVNQERTRAGLKPLEVDMRLVQTARAKSQDMIKNSYFSHTSPTYGNPYQQMKAAGITGYSVLGGENIAGNPTVQGAHTTLMNSPGHKANLLDARYTHIGIGVSAGGTYGKMFTQHFAGN
jgi:uncharacterized YkwD family protein